MTYIAEQFQQVTLQEPAPWQNPAVFNFEAEVAQVWRDFPRIQDTVLFFDVTTGIKIVYPAASQEKREVMQRRYEGIVCIEAEELGRTSFCTPVPSGPRLICLLLEKNGKLDRTATAEQETVYAFDHELGHALVPDGVGKDINTAECVADAYAVIRHLQRYGANSPTIDAIVANRTFDLVFESPGYGRSHFTSPVIEAILALRHEIDWNSLTPEQTVQRAHGFAKAHKMEAGLLRSLHKVFDGFHDKVNDIRNGDVALVPALAEKVLSTNSSRIFKYGAVALELCIDQQAAAGILAGKYGDNLREKLAQKQQGFTQSKPSITTTPKRFGL